MLEQTLIKRLRLYIETNDQKKVRYVWDRQDVLQGEDRKGLVEYFEKNAHKLPRRVQSSTAI